MRQLIFALPLLCLMIFGCTTTPDGVTPITNFELKPYLGTWYEIARLDHSFERGLSNVSATYSMRDDDGVRVLNKGYNAQKQTWKDAEGKGYYASTPNVGHLKVSFFGPFYGSYVIFKLDPNGQYAFVTGNNKDYLWLLSRTPAISDALKQDFIDTASTLGYATDKLIWVDQSENQAQLRDDDTMREVATEPLAD